MRHVIIGLAGSTEATHASSVERKQWILLFSSICFPSIDCFFLLSWEILSRARKEGDLYGSRLPPRGASGSPQQGPRWGPDSRAGAAAQCRSTCSRRSSLSQQRQPASRQPVIRKSAEAARVGVARRASVACTWLAWSDVMWRASHRTCHRRCCTFRQFFTRAAAIFLFSVKRTCYGPMDTFS